MKFIQVRELRNNTARIWRELPKEKEMVITNHGRPVALLSAVNGSDVVDTLAAVRQARALANLEAIQRRSVELGLDKMTMEEIDAEIAAARRQHRR